MCVYAGAQSHYQITQFNLRVIRLPTADHTHTHIHDTSTMQWLLFIACSCSYQMESYHVNGDFTNFCCTMLFTELFDILLFSWNLFGEHLFQSFIARSITHKCCKSWQSFLKSEEIRKNESITIKQIIGFDLQNCAKRTGLLQSKEKKTFYIKSESWRELQWIHVAICGFILVNNVIQMKYVCIFAVIIDRSGRIIKQIVENHSKLVKKTYTISFVATHKWNILIWTTCFIIYLSVFPSLSLPITH